MSERSLADDGAGLGVADEHARDEVVGLRLHAGLALQVLVHPHMHLVQRILQPSDVRDSATSAVMRHQSSSGESLDRRGLHHASGTAH